MGAAFLKDLRLILRDRWLVLFTLLVPVGVITIISSALLSGDRGPRMSIAVVDEDGGPVARTLARALAEYADVVELPRDEAVHFVRDRNRGPAAIVFPAGLSERYPQGKPTEIVLLTDPAQEAGLRTVKVLLLLMEKKAEALDNPFAEPMVVLKEQSLTGERQTVSPFEQNLPGFALMFVLIAVIFGTALSLHDERDWGTMPRLLVAPVGITRILLGKLGARFVIGVAQLLLLLVWSYVLYGVSLGSSPLGFVALTCAVVLAMVATGLVVAAVTRSREQVQPLALAAVVVLCSMGGLWWPQALVPDWMRRVAPVAYTSWAMNGYTDLVLRDRGVAALLQPLAVLTLYALGLLAIGLRLFQLRHAVK